MSALRSPMGVAVPRPYTTPRVSALRFGTAHSTHLHFAVGLSAMADA
jgi:hypothetical protein